jgi:hypothetical protein
MVAMAIVLLVQALIVFAVGRFIVPRAVAAT